MALREISLRIRLIGGSAFAVAVLLIVCVGFLYAFSRQELTVQEIKQQEIARSAKIGNLLTRLSNVHRTLSETLAAATQKKVDEEVIFERGRAAIDSVREMVDQFSEERALFEEDSKLLSLFDETARDLKTYRSTVLSVVE